jgi:HSP20 family protein
MTALVETFPDWLRELNRVVGSSQRQTAPLTPAADLVEDEDGVTVHMDVPGVPADQLEIELQNDVLTVRGTRPYPYPRQDGESALRRAERGFGRFERSLRVPPGLNPDAIQASLADGVLTLRIPKPEQLKPHRIPVTAAQGDGQ